jgi:hypothetical protein
VVAFLLEQFEVGLQLNEPSGDLRSTGFELVLFDEAALISIE